MAKTLTQQFRMLAPSSTDTEMFGDGGPLHSATAYDLMLALNNMQTKCEPSYQLLYDCSSIVNVGGSIFPRCRITRPDLTYPSFGVAMLGQAPIYVPLDAYRMNLNIGIYRHAPSEFSYTVNVKKLWVYLSQGPCSRLLDPIVPNPAPHEDARGFDPTYMRGPRAEFHDLLLPATLSDSTSQYVHLSYNTWLRENTYAGGVVSVQGFAAKGVGNINDVKTNPWAWMVIAVEYDGMSEDESIQLGEVAVWFDYE